MPLLLKLPLIAAVALAITLGLPRTLVQLSLPITDKANQTAEHPKSEKRMLSKNSAKPSNRQLKVTRILLFTFIRQREI